MTEDIKTIRAAVESNCGGSEKWTDQQIKFYWSSLDADTKEKYLSLSKEKKRNVKDAVSPGPRTNIKNNTGQ